MTILQTAKNEISKRKPGELVDLDDYSFHDTDMEELARLLRQAKHTKVSIRASNITQVGAAKLAECTDLVYLLIDQNNLGDKGAEILLTLPNLRELHICTNGLTDEGARLIKAKCGASFRANVYGNRRVSNALILEIDSKWKECKPDASAVSPPSKGPGYSPGHWRTSSDNDSSDSSSSSADAMAPANSDSPPRINETPSSARK